MKRVLFKRSLRDLKENWARYTALALLIIFSIYIVLSLVGAATATIDQTAQYDEELNCEDGEFSVFVPLTDSELNRITKKGVDIEKMFFLDYQMEDGSVCRVYKNRNDINKITLKEGRIAENDSEIVVERRYAEVNDINIGDIISIGDFDGTDVVYSNDYTSSKSNEDDNENLRAGDSEINEVYNFTVVGIGAVSDYNSPLKNLSDASVDSNSFGLLFVTESAYDELNESKTAMKSEEYYYSYKLNDSITHDELKDILKENSFNANSVDDAYFREYYERISGGSALSGVMLSMFQDSDMFADSTSNLISILKAEDNVRIDAAADDVAINKSAGIMVGILLIILFSYVISVFVVHTIDRESAVIGALYSMGVKKRDLMSHYIVLPVMVTFVSGVFGLILATSRIGIEVQMQDNYNYFSMPNMHPEVSPFMIAYALIFPPVLSAIVNALVIRSRLNRTPLSLLKNEQKVSKSKDVKLKEMEFIKLFKIRQLLRERRTGFTVVFGLFMSLLVAMLAVNVYVYCDKVNVRNVEDTHFEYMYTYKYPSEKVPEGGYEAVAENMKKRFGEYNFDVTILGINEDNPFFDIEKLPKSKNEVVVSDSFAYKYQLKKGEEFTLTSEDGDRAYAFTVAGITRYSTSFMVFMNIEECRELFGEMDDYFNVVFSDHMLDIPSGRLYGTLKKSDVENAANIFLEQMSSMIITMAAASAVIFVVVMYLMMKMMLDKSSFNIALVKIFGFRNKEVRRMYLDGNFYIVAGGALLSIPICKLILNYVYPNYLVSNVAAGFEQSFPFYIYVMIYVIIIVLYLIINNALVGKIKKMVPAEVLKNRE
ncbi:MAG: ABC transporter permease [Lachnospiraceae bacterium]|nr:ABC transporter permease [Lachnospiraceae bacterium]